MPLPAAAQAQRERLQQESNAGQNNGPAGTVVQPNGNPAPNPAPNGNPPQNNEPPTNVPDTDAGKVTISRKEFNELQANAGRVKSVEARAQSMQDDLEALQARLTELEAGSKGSHTGGAPSPAPSVSAGVQFDAAPVPLTDKEKADFEEDTIALMEKIANNAAKAVGQQLIQLINDKLGSLEQNVTHATQGLQQVRTKSFNDRVMDEVAKFSDFQSIVKHEHWKSFLESENIDAGEQYMETLARNVKNENLNAVVNVMRKFHDKYIKDAVDTTAGYAGANPSGAVETPAGPKGPEVLKISERREAHRKYINKQISYEEYETVKKKFDIAEREGRIDYDN